MERATSPLDPGHSIVIGTEPFASPAPSAVVAEAERELLMRYGFLADSEADLVADMFDAPLGAFLVARSPDGVVVGGVGVRTREPGVGEVKRLWVAPDGRGRGIGRALMDELEDAARRLGLTELRLATGFRQPEAVSLYESSGWQRQWSDWDGSALNPHVFLFRKDLT
ncbi:MAG TPA: GNAT family N-acetyltransferase [Acidimicrobiales bacterium]